MEHSQTLSQVYFLVIPVLQDHCRRQLCECDKAAAYCFARNLNTYKRRYQVYPNWMCRGRDYWCFPPLDI
ncbi:Phospholipase A2, membrane associated [Myotis davidii]|uniref:Phospholipase A2, membrane associated n=1 Tax=Myotis davidii TaxID=225400 RepID=L5LCK5_MYODS|nr:Phospholipase A2, membrane associated [Myotis davidii]